MDVKTLCLGALVLGDASGYEIKKQFEEGAFAYFHAAGFGSIYPALNALSAAGYVTFHEEAQEGRPAKKVYSITPAGLEAFRNALRKNPAADTLRSETLFMLFFSDLLSKEHRRDVYETYLDHYRAALECVSDPCTHGMKSGHLFVKGMGAVIYRAVVEYMEQNRHLLDDPETSESAGGQVPNVGVAE